MSNDVLKVLVGAREQDKYVDWGMLMISCGTRHLSQLYLQQLERNGYVTVVRGDVVKVILTYEGYLRANFLLEAKGVI